MGGSDFPSAHIYIHVCLFKRGGDRLFCTWDVSTVRRNRASAMRRGNNLTSSTSPDTSSMTASTSGEYESVEAAAEGGRRTEEYTSGVDNLSSELAQACQTDTEGALNRLLRESSLIVQWRRRRQVYDSYIDVRSTPGAGRVVAQSKKDQDLIYVYKVNITRGGPA